MISCNGGILARYIKYTECQFSIISTYALHSTSDPYGIKSLNFGMGVLMSSNFLRHPNSLLSFLADQTLQTVTMSSQLSD